VFPIPRPSGILSQRTTPMHQAPQTCLCMKMPAVLPWQGSTGGQAPQAPLLQWCWDPPVQQALLQLPAPSPPLHHIQVQQKQVRDCR
jgi:hypothetical protein